MDFLLILGGLEHLQSTSLLSDPFRFDKEEGYYTLYQLVAHEFFHAWNVKRIKDVVLGPFDYSKENYTKLLWFHEGFTSYMEHQIVNRAGVVPWKYSIKQYENLWNLVAQHPGRLSQSLEESSFDTWIRYYQQNEWTEVSSISYYDHGELTGWLMEAEIVEGSKGQWGLKIFSVSFGLTTELKESQMQIFKKYMRNFRVNHQLHFGINTFADLAHPTVKPWLLSLA